MRRQRRWRTVVDHGGAGAPAKTVAAKVTCSGGGRDSRVEARRGAEARLAVQDCWQRKRYGLRFVLIWIAFGFVFRALLGICPSVYFVIYLLPLFQIPICSIHWVARIQGECWWLAEGRWPLQREGRCRVAVGLLLIPTGGCRWLGMETRKWVRLLCEGERGRLMYFVKIQLFDCVYVLGLLQKQRIQSLCVTSFSLSGVLQMKILEANAGALTNFEVLDFLRAKGASKDPTRVIAKVAQSEYKVYDYLVGTAASDQTKETINEFLTSIKQHDLAKAEVLNILNTRPVADVEIFPIIENCEGRFSDDEVNEIVELVKKTLPPPPNMKQDEITKG
ncbi:unnamed protein product [Sphenostylis stenocarpa]|uniref:DNA-directed RNA polymerase III subunit RPC9 n=1 Tax=Sphenostylis stenocarpa TaxID=92480 RepID=A0AA86RPD5_9FABA|nr:unnamed protein product [Sphenostylis stenocarpa]